MKEETFAPVNSDIDNVDLDDDSYEDGLDGKLTWAEKFKRSLTKMFETEDQSIN
ncbi:MAG: hypothetical protein R2744_09565 [Bacteroidales bacterium]